MTTQSTHIPIDDVFIQDLKKALVNDLISSVEKAELDFANMRKSANFILDHIASVHDNASLMDFLEKLHTHWPSFNSTYKIYKNKFHGDREQDVINRLSDYIKTFDQEAN